MAKASTQVVKAKSSNLPATTKAMFAQELADLQKRISAPSGDRIMVTQGKTFKLPNGTELDELEAVIVDFSAANFFYTEGYERGQITPPQCFALGLEPAGLIPSENSPEKQAESCAACWANAFGSAGKGKACSNQRLLALLPPDADAETPLMILKVSPTALKSFDGHVAAVARSKGVPVRGVITKLSFSQDTDYASLRFSLLDDAPVDLIEQANARLAEARQRLLTEPDVSALTAANDSKPAAKRTLGKVAPKKPAPRRAA
jgi:hypothetical protein